MKNLTTLAVGFRTLDGKLENVESGSYPTPPERRVLERSRSGIVLAGQSHCAFLACAIR